MSKTLSTGTLSLRFMQNAQRAKQLKEVELERAEVQDDGKWEVSQAVRDAWGLGASSSSRSIDNVHEASYLPFLFANDGSEASTSAPATAPGRRIFNKRGEDVSSKSSATEEPDMPIPLASSPSQPTGGRKVHPRPVTLSATSGKVLLKGFDSLETSSTGSTSRKGKQKQSDLNAKSARQAIFETADVGVDLRSKPQPKPPSTFMKPAGVDVPKEMVTGQGPPTTKPKSRAQEIIERARARQQKQQADTTSSSVPEFLKPNGVDAAPSVVTDTIPGSSSAVQQPANDIKKKKRNKRKVEDDQIEKTLKKKKKSKTVEDT